MFYTLIYKLLVIYSYALQLTSTRYCKYSYICSWWWVEIPPETCRAVSEINKLCKDASRWKYIKRNILRLHGPLNVKRYCFFVFLRILIKSKTVPNKVTYIKPHVINASYFNNEPFIRNQTAFDSRRQRLRTSLSWNR